MNAGLYVVIGAAVGLLGSLSGTWLTESRLDRRAERQRQTERELRRDDLQRDTLIGLQEALLRVMRTSWRLTLNDRLQANQGVQWGTAMAPPDLDQESLLAFQDVAKLVERVLDDDVRTRVEETTDAASRLGLARSHAESQQIEREMAAAYTRASKRIGVVLRATF